ncbi:MAG: hypothetical protein EOP82_07210 [Variovorax sp.]|nr:MAG: hypothetical protein EOP82_07210 [Variovorax sp.]
MNSTLPDRSAEDIGNIVHLEHVNLTVPDQLLATRFYVTALGLTRDPYLNTGVENMWVNIGRTQFHLPHGPAQHFRGTVRLVMPARDELLARLRQAEQALRGTEFAFDDSHADHVDVLSPWGNRLECFEPDPARFGATQLGIVELVFDVPIGSTAGIARFYREVFGAPAQSFPGEARVQVGAGQWLTFSETSAALLPYDGHHIQIYVADFSGPHRRLHALGLVTEESNRHQYRFMDIADPQSGAPCFRVEHEVRSMTHPLFARPLVNRDPRQRTGNYLPGADAFVPRWPN